MCYNNNAFDCEDTIMRSNDTTQEVQYPKLLKWADDVICKCVAAVMTGSAGNQVNRVDALENFW